MKGEKNTILHLNTKRLFTILKTLKMNNNYLLKNDRIIYFKVFFPNTFADA